MEDFEYSVDISDRDWECFFTECEECSLLPPSLAGVDDSGMSDIDDTGSILSKRVQKVDLTDGFSEADRPIDGPPDCEGSPVEHYLSNHTIGGMESVLSGSEEDIHLQSVNIFFERLKRVTEAESLIDPNQERDGKKQEAIQEEEQRSDGQQASSRFLPKHLLQLNSLPASGETAVGKETTNLVNTIDRINTMKEDVPGPKISPKPAASTVALTTYTSAYPKKGSFFYPLITKEKLVPIFPYSRSATRDLKFPEAYEHFFASSSSDDSSGESDEEDGCSPVRVVTRFSRKTSASQISTDIYEHFFTDGDLRQNFFWNTTLSFRNMSLTKSTIHKESLSNPQSCVPVRQSSRSIGRIVHPVNALGNEDIMFPDPLLHHLDNRFYTQLIHQPFSFDDLQTAVSNPRLDASLLPLRQSDMCLVCIAFASWVLKTANPQVGDTWKAVLLANVSALSAIRYLRKYVKMEAAASERKLKYTAPSDS
ncbi:hypothetical protein PBY51_000464 [Eleginops maclovinus]|uniref:PGC-1 and ERR-induced regulator in muscle protein 1 n=1 Tax=Eleginops maclovinus TaxID=56733 RepID=A0AAN7XJX1_ELEMC|nr:hypothetical protein PBY51_000464 [Eleginops maclovinus]